MGTAPVGNALRLTSSGLGFRWSLITPRDSRKHFAFLYFQRKGAGDFGSFSIVPKNQKRDNKGKLIL